MICREPSSDPQDPQLFPQFLWFPVNPASLILWAMFSWCGVFDPYGSRNPIPLSMGFLEFQPVFVCGLLDPIIPSVTGWCLSDNNGLRHRSYEYSRIISLGIIRIIVFIHLYTLVPDHPGSIRCWLPLVVSSWTSHLATPTSSKTLPQHILKEEKL